MYIRKGEKNDNKSSKVLLLNGHIFYNIPIII